MKNTIFVFLLAFISCFPSMEKGDIPGTYYSKYDNGIEQFLILSPDGNYKQFINFPNDSILKNSDSWSCNFIESEIIFDNYFNVGIPSFPNSGGKFSSYQTCLDISFSGQIRIVIFADEGLYFNKINSNTNVDSIKTLLKIE